jgi:hypothetical protein
MKTALCNHVKTNGAVCESPALKNQSFCYFHTAARDRAKRQRRAAQLKLPFQLPILEDANSIQVAIADTLNALLTGQIDHKTAGLVLYGLQTAATNLRHTDFEVSDYDRHVDTYEPAEPAEEDVAEQPLASPSIASTPRQVLPPKKSPYTAEQKKLLDQACNIAMHRARAIKEQFVAKPK